MKEQMNRKEFLQTLFAISASAAGLYLAGCQRQNSSLSLTEATQILTLTHTTRPPTPVAIARGGEPEQLVRAAVDSLGGMGKFITPGDDVVIKPNVCVDYLSYEYAATTNPFVVGTLVKLALESGARRVRVMDNPFGQARTAQQAYRTSGIAEQVDQAGGEMVVMQEMTFTQHQIPDAWYLKNILLVSDQVLAADVVINVPVAKTHGLAKLTLAMKNMMGAIRYREHLHSNLGPNIADLNRLVRSDLVVVDAVRMLMDNGPTGGNLEDVKKADTVIATGDVVAADSVAAGLFGLKPTSLAYVTAARKMDTGESYLENMILKEVRLG